MTDLTEGQRIYAVGDIHGRLDLLADMLARIRGDLAARPHSRPLLIFLGDYVDRGPEVRGVLEALVALKAEAGLPARFLLGNHDNYVLAYLRDPHWYDETHGWLRENLGGNATLASYGVPEAAVRPPQLAREAFAAAFPPEHLAFIAGCELTLRVGGYLFVHAGIRPGVPVEMQERADLIWIREPFLTSKADFGFKVVHGHTIVPAVEHRSNRIAVDTGAVRSGVLSCVVLEDETVGLLTPDGPRACPVGSGLPSWRSLWIRR
jgi:serine/threonine protein phosphatase 1